MAFLARQRLNFGRLKWQGRLGCFCVIALLSAAATGAQAQIIVGGNKRPAVSIDNSVLDRLGPPLTLPEFYMGSRAPARTAVVRPTMVAEHVTQPGRLTQPSRHVKTRHVASRRRHTAPVTRMAAAAPISGSSLNRIIHLIPPAPRVVSTAPGTTVASAAPAPVSHDQAAISEPTKPTVAALTAPAPSSTPKPPAAPSSNETPTPPILPAQPVRDAVPTPPVTPPTQPAMPPTVTAMATPPAPPAATTPAASPSASATPADTTAAPVRSPLFVSRTPVASGVPPLQVTPQVAAAPATSVAPPPASIPSPTAANAASPGPRVGAPAATTAATPPVQMAAATTLGNSISAVKFGSGTTELPTGPQPALDAVASKLLGNDNLRVQVIAHATGNADQAMEARRISLARAVAVRAYLIDKGIRSLRIDVRALGNRADDGPATDQVDLTVVSQ